MNNENEQWMWKFPQMAGISLIQWKTPFPLIQGNLRRRFLPPLLIVHSPSTIPALRESSFTNGQQRGAD
jgi:hypothetical protein